MGLRIEKVGWVALIGGGFSAVLIGKLLNANGIYLGFIGGVLLWFACYWTVKKIAEKIL